MSQNAQLSRATSRRRSIARAAASAALLAMAGSASAQVLYWDLNGSTLGIGGAGVWDTTTANWNTDPLGTLTTQAWSAGNIAQFSAGTTTTSAFTVTVPAGVQIPGVNGINFEEGVVTLAGGDATSGITLNNGATLTHGGGGTSSTSRTHTISTNLLGANGITFANPSTNSTGTFNLSGTNTFSGTLNVNGATLSSGTNVTAGGVNLIISSPAQLGTTGAIVFGPSGSTFGGGTTVFTTGNAFSRLFINATGTQTYNQALTISSGGLRAGPGGLQINSGNVNWTGDVTVNSSSNNEANNLAGIGVATGSTLTLTGNLSNAAGVGSATVGNVWTKSGEGTLVLGGASPNSLVGFTRVFNGVLVIAKDGALGAAGPGGFIETHTIQNALSGVNSTIAFAPGVDYTTAEVITLGGANDARGFNGMGALAGLAGGTSRFAGNIRVGGVFDTPTNTITNSIGVESGGTLELAGKIFASTGGGTYDISTGPAEPSFRRIVKLGGGTLVISGSNDGSFGAFDGGVATTGFNNLLPFAELSTGGTLQINGGAVVLRSSSPTGGSLVGYKNPVTLAETPFNFTVNPTGALILDNSLAVNTNRVSALATINLTGGELSLVGNAATPVTQSFGGGSGSVALASFSTLSVTSPGAQTILDLGSTGRTARGTALVRGVNGSTSQLQLSPGGELSTNVGGGGGAGSPLLGIVPALVGDASATGPGSDFVTFDVTNGIRPLVASEYAALVSGSSALNNVSTSGSPTVGAATTVNALRLAPGTNLTTNAQLTINSGAILAQDGGASTIGGSGSLNFSREGIFHVVGANQLSVSASVAGGDGITKSGTGTLVLSGTNNYSGDTTINAGVLQASSFANLGVGGQFLLNGGTLRATGDFSIPLGRQINVGDLAGGSLNVASGNTLTAVTPIVGNGQLVKAGPGVLVMTAGNSLFGGNLRINEGTVRVPNNDSLGTGSVILNSGTLAVTTPGQTIDRNIVLEATQSTIDVSSGGVHTYSGQFTGAGGMRISGAGTFTPTGNNLYFGSNGVINGATFYYTTTVGLGSTPPVLKQDYWSLDNGTLGFGLVNQGTLTSTAVSALRGLTVGAGGGAFRVDPQTVGTTTWSTVSFGAPIVGTGTLTKVGLGSLTLTTVNTGFTGLMQVAEGQLRGGDGGLGGGDLGIVGGTVVTTSGLVRNTRTVVVGAAGGTFDTGTFANTVGSVSGPGTLNKIGTGGINATNFRVGNLNVTAGTLAVAAGATPADPANASQIGSNAAGGALTLATGTSLNLRNNALVVNYAGASPRASLEALVTSGYAAGSWNGTGINSSSAAATAGHAVGIAEATDLGSPGTFAGQAIDGTSVLIRYTRVGDANLSGTTDIGDFSILAANFNSAGRWGTGDFDYTGQVDIGDFSLLAANFNSAATGALPRGSVVPEPTGLALIGLAAAGLMARRRRNA